MCPNTLSFENSYRHTLEYLHIKCIAQPTCVTQDPSSLKCCHKKMQFHIGQVRTSCSSHLSHLLTPKDHQREAFRFCNPLGTEDGIQSPQNPQLPVLLSQSCSSALSALIYCSVCAKGGNIPTGKACCHHASPIATYCNGIKYGARIFHFVMLLSFIGIWRNPSILLKNI